MRDDQSIDLRDYIDVLLRRRVLFLIAVTAIFVILAALALRWPSTYRSTATILIEEQEIPPDLVRSAITSSAAQRIKTISEQVMTRRNLRHIIEKYDLYANARTGKTTEHMIQSMRERFKVEVLNVDVMDPKSGRPGEATISITLSFEGRSPEVTQKVASELATLFLEQNLRSRTERATETLRFLTLEANEFSEYIAELEEKLAVFKQRNIDRLPELEQLNQRLMDRTEQQIMDTENHIRSLEERRYYLEGELAQMNPMSPMFSASGQRILDEASRLTALRAEYVYAASRYTPDHPDVVRLGREIGAIEKNIGNLDLSHEEAKELARLRTQLAVVQEKYSKNHPDVIKLIKEISSLEAMLKETRSSARKTDLIGVTPDNPAFITLQARLKAVDSELGSERARTAQLRAKLADYEQRIFQGPQVEQHYLALNREYDNAVRRYQEIKEKQMDAQVRQELEKEHGERFTLIDPPHLPEDAIKPNRLLALSLGLIFALTGGVGSVMVAEARDSPALRRTEQRRTAEARDNPAVRSAEQRRIAEAYAVSVTKLKQRDRATTGEQRSSA